MSTIRRGSRPLPRSARLLACLLLLVGLCEGCRDRGDGVRVASNEAQSPPQEAQQARPAATPQVSLYDLQRDEALGGHTLARHVGRTDEQLAERLRREPGISAASTYTDATTARRTVALALEQSRDRVDGWASRQGSRPNLALNYAQHSGPPFGRSLTRGETVARPCDRALVVLRWLEREHRWIVLTSYPETRR